jgi:hypothetical protein
MAAPRGIELDEHILCVVQDELVEILSDDDFHRLVIDFRDFL